MAADSMADAGIAAVPEAGQSPEGNQDAGEGAAPAQERRWSRAAKGSATLLAGRLAVGNARYFLPSLMMADVMQLVFGTRPLVVLTNKHKNDCGVSRMGDDFPRFLPVADRFLCLLSRSTVIAYPARAVSPPPGWDV